jgi:hypothetical protein
LALFEMRVKVRRGPKRTARDHRAVQRRRKDHDTVPESWKSKYGRTLTTRCSPNLVSAFLVAHSAQNRCPSAHWYISAWHRRQPLSARWYVARVVMRMDTMAWMRLTDFAPGRADCGHATLRGRASDVPVRFDSP